MLARIPAGLAFRHDLLRQAAYESLPVSRGWHCTVPLPRRCGVPARQ